jgi:hypothetical protein
MRLASILALLMTASGSSLCAGIDLQPSDDAFHAAVQRLTLPEQEVIGRGFGFKLIASDLAFTSTEKLPPGRVRKDTPTHVNIIEYIRYLGLLQTQGKEPRVKIKIARVFAGLTYDATTFHPLFKVQMEVDVPTVGVVVVTGFGSGPRCSRFSGGESLFSGGESLYAPRLVQSTNIAFMESLLKVLLSINSLGH